MKRSIVLLLCAAMGFAATAQTDNKKRLIEECQRLYSDGEYTTALSLLEELDTKGLDSNTRQEVELLKALGTYENNVLEGRALMLQYLSDYPESAKYELLSCYIALSYYYSKDYEKACTWFEKCDLNRLTPKQRDEATLYYALSLLNTGREAEAEHLLQSLSLAGKDCAKDAIFHLAVIHYNRGELDKAYEKFKRIENNPKYKLDVAYYLVGIDTRQGKLTRAEKYARLFIESYGATLQGMKMRQLLGAILYQKGNYREAAETLALYVNNYDAPQRIAFYQLGISLYSIEEYDEALKMLTVCTEGDDEIAQSSLLHIGFIHLNNNDANSARMALEQASKMRQDDKVRERALYNYALCLHKTSYSPFGESVKAFEQFLNDYPNSEYAGKVGELLVEEYTKTRNYDIALQSINKISKPSADILDAKMKMLFRLGVQEFINGNMDGAIKYMDQSLEEAKYNKYAKKTKGEALFWKGEALFRKGNLEEARNVYSQALATDEANNRKAMYGIGYTYFMEGKYDEARAEFDRFVDAAERESYGVVADAYNRIGDCHFYQRRFDEAANIYSKAANIHRDEQPYALYRMAQIQSLQNKRESSLNTLRKLIDNFPNSPYTEQVLYEMGRNYIKQEQYFDAIDTYDQLMASFPDSEISRRAAVERAMIYNTVGDRESAITAYKEVIAKYPQSDEAQVAIQDLKSIYVDMGRVDLFAEYTSGTEGVQKIQSSEIDTMAYNAAEKIYGRGDLKEAKRAFDNYLKQYPHGAFRINSHYYKGLISLEQGAKEEALKDFEKVLGYADKKYREEALMHSANIYFDKKNYKKASEYYRQVASQTKDDGHRTVAYSNMLTGARKLGNYNEIIQVATTIENHPKMSPEMKRKAVFSRGEAYLAQDNKDKALEDFDKLAEDTRSKEGAEAKYLVAQILFDDKCYDDCEDEINSFIEMSTPHSYWLARSFILLADLYTVQGKTMEAKQYLISLQNNYDGKDDIAGMIKKRLSKLSTEK